jgi:hypothetical protein
MGPDQCSGRRAWWWPGRPFAATAGWARPSRCPGDRTECASIADGFRSDDSRHSGSVVGWPDRRRWHHGRPEQKQGILFQDLQRNWHALQRVDVPLQHRQQPTGRSWRPGRAGNADARQSRPARRAGPRAGDGTGTGPRTARIRTGNRAAWNPRRRPGLIRSS